MTASTHSSAASTRARSGAATSGRPGPFSARTEASEFRQTIRQTASVSSPPARRCLGRRREAVISACPQTLPQPRNRRPKPRLTRPAPSGMNGHPVRRRPGPFSLLLLRDQCGVADRGDDRPDPARLAQAPWPWTATWPKPPKTLRYRVLHTAARLVRGGRKRRLKIQATWPWAEAITAARMKPAGLTPVSNLMSLARGDHRSITALLCRGVVRSL